MKKIVRGKIVKKGKSLFLIFPKSIAKRYSLEKNQELHFLSDGKTLRIII